MAMTAASDWAMNCGSALSSYLSSISPKSISSTVPRIKPLKRMIS
jgi:hypothetical protein